MGAVQLFSRSGLNSSSECLIAVKYLFVAREFICLSHPVHMFGTGIGSKHREDPCAATNIQDYFVFEHVLVVVHGVPVGQRPHLIFQHLLQRREE